MTTAAPGNQPALRRVVATLLLTSSLFSTLVAQSSATSGPTTRYARLYVFGDSYSDIGAGYIDGNGPPAVAYLGWLMGLQVASSSAAMANDKSLVFAVSGAGTGEGAGEHVKASLLGYGMMNQVRDFAARVKSGAITFDPRTTLFFLAGGLNDGRLETDHAGQPASGAPNPSRTRRAALHDCTAADEDPAIRGGGASTESRLRAVRP
jgi:hypothetical protein